MGGRGDGARGDGFEVCVRPGRAAAGLAEHVEHHVVGARAGRAAAAADGGSPTTADDPGTKSAPVVAPARAVRRRGVSNLPWKFIAASRAFPPGARTSGWSAPGGDADSSAAGA